MEQRSVSGVRLVYEFILYYAASIGGTMTIDHSVSYRTHTPTTARHRPRRVTDAPRRRWSHRPKMSPGVRAAARELLLLAVLYVGYTASRLLADDNLRDAAGTAKGLLHIETLLDLDWEHRLNAVFVDHDWLGLFGSYWYASGHYIVTLAVLVWLYARHRQVYRRARTALVAATFAALGCYLLLPTAPPRLLGGFTDVLSLHADVGWWGSEASAPKGMGGATNQLAAFPSMHAGWALWVAIAVAAATGSWLARTLGFAYAATTSLVVIGTANHWALDVIVGGAVVVLAWLAVIGAPAVISRLRRLRLEVTVPSAVPVPGFRLTCHADR
ncbi:phosphatase PAP2 family protein [Flexivirga sp. B27]